MSAVTTKITNVTNKAIPAANAKIKPITPPIKLNSPTKILSKLVNKIFDFFF
jgi:hypothetical protein